MGTACIDESTVSRLLKTFIQDKARNPLSSAVSPLEVVSKVEIQASASLKPLPDVMVEAFLFVATVALPVSVYNVYCGHKSVSVLIQDKLTFIVGKLTLPRLDRESLSL